MMQQDHTFFWYSDGAWWIGNDRQIFPSLVVEAGPFTTWDLLTTWYEANKGLPHRNGEAQ